MISDKRLDEVSKEALQIYYDKKNDKLATITLDELITNKNPYLFKANGVYTMTDLIENFLSATMSSSEETLFGQIVFEVFVSKFSDYELEDKTNRTNGIDLTKEDINARYDISMKSGINVFNSSSRAKQLSDFKDIKKRVNEHTEYYPMIGYGYGKKTKIHDNYSEFAGQAFWEKITGEDDFHIRLLNSIGRESEVFVTQYKRNYEMKKESLLIELLDNYCKNYEDNTSNHLIDWEKILETSSSYYYSKIVLCKNDNSSARIKLNSREGNKIEVLGITPDLSKKDTDREILLNNSQFLEFEIVKGQEFAKFNNDQLTFFNNTPDKSVVTVKARWLNKTSKIRSFQLDLK